MKQLATTADWLALNKSLQRTQAIPKYGELRTGATGSVTLHFFPSFLVQPVVLKITSVKVPLRCRAWAKQRQDSALFSGSVSFWLHISHLQRQEKLVEKGVGVSSCRVQCLPESVPRPLRTRKQESNRQQSFFKDCRVRCGVANLLVYAIYGEMNPWLAAKLV